LALDGNAIMAVFGFEAQILSLLMDESIMQQEILQMDTTFSLEKPLVPIYIT
jgi:hypothetical protein